MNKIIKFLSGENIYLRPFNELLDLDLFYLGENNPEVRETLFLHSPLSKNEAKEKMEEWISKSENKIFTICEAESNTPVGITGLYRIDHVSRVAVFYIAIYNPDFWSRGYGTEATKLVLKYSFDVLNLNRIELHVSTANIKGIKAYTKCGFVTEGTIREAMYHNNEYVDFYLMSILRKEYYKEK